MTDTPETEACVKEHKHIRFLEEDHWSLNGKFTFTHPIVALCRRLERQRDGLKSAADCASDLLATAIAERDAWKAKFIQQNKDLGCEMMDPNGTIWDYAKKMQKDLDTAIVERDEALAAVKKTNQND